MSPEPPVDGPFPFDDPSSSNNTADDNADGSAAPGGPTDDHPSRRNRSGAPRDESDVPVLDPTSRSAPRFVPLSLEDFLA